MARKYSTSRLDLAKAMPAANVKTLIALESVFQAFPFTPKVEGQTTAGVGTYTHQAGQFQQIGGLILFTVDLAWTSHTGTGNLIITGLPQPAGSRTAATVFQSGVAFTGQLQALIVQDRVEIFQTSGALPIDAAGTLLISGFYWI